MADPVTLGIVALGVSLVGTGMSAFGQYQQGQAQEAASKYNAQVIQGEAAFEEEKSRERARRLMSMQRAFYAKAGVSISTDDSPLLVMAHTAAEFEEEALNIRLKGYNQAQMERWQGGQYAKAGAIGGVSTFLSGLGSAATQYAAYKGAPGRTVTGPGRRY